MGCKDLRALFLDTGVGNRQLSWLGRTCSHGNEQAVFEVVESAFRTELKGVTLIHLPGHRPANSAFAALDIIVEEGGVTAARSGRAQEFVRGGGFALLVQQNELTGQVFTQRMFIGQRAFPARIFKFRREDLGAQWRARGVSHNRRIQIG